MKTILKIALPILLISFLTTSCATTVRVRPARTIVITKLHNPTVIVHKSVRYYRSGGVWYVKNNRGYRTVAAPVGVKVATLPRGYKVVKVKGVRYYRCNGVYYKRARRGYVIVNV
ncbi:DUF6515 family protein [Aquimarina gracilis]|uniref:DUF6515 family protein n=1 Tax=Aquimarina gracilis TaxID=874422 RepID=A0ABU5ZVC3_9FLAO|nr:DUF6515 family protein [Aquimarina gracilis]MEB3345502.1 DUF6515 family protein [Aquimarina gracilis]